MEINIYLMRENETICFAAQELKKYISKIDSTIEPVIKAYEPLGDKGIKLGLYEDFDFSAPEVEDADYDDALTIDVKNLDGIIAGINYRSILFGVYKYLEALGVRWIRHGVNGEIIPQKSIEKTNVRLESQPSNRHRVMCIEGSVSIENMLDNIDWATKMGFNTYYIQFFEPAEFFERWYLHKDNKYLKEESITSEKINEYKRIMIKEIKKRGLLLHRIGHGWNCMPFGLSAGGWYVSDKPIDESIADMFALTDGKRQFYQGKPLNTGLCLSNPKARKTVIDYFVNYVEENKEIDVIHFYLQDGSNNVCECEECKKAIPTDFYVELLNELDDELTKKGIKTKIAFCIYMELLLPPQTKSIINKDRFILVFAPITRNYRDINDKKEYLGNLAEYKRNDMKFPITFGENAAYLKGWQNKGETDGLLFEYYLYKSALAEYYYMDLGQYRLSEIISEDIKGLKNLKLNGMLSCQSQRAFTPTGLASYVMAKTLWDTQLQFEEIAEEYFKLAFGEHGNKCMQILKSISELCNVTFEKRLLVWKDPEAVKGFVKVYDIISENQPFIEENLNNADEYIAYSFRYLKFYLELAKKMINLFITVSEGKKEMAIDLWRGIKDFIQFNEMETQSVFDVELFIEGVEIYIDLW